MKKILESKRALRRDLASRSIEEKLRLLDALRERYISIRGSKKPVAEPRTDAASQKQQEN